MSTTCQICARQILAKTGVIAHHGYRRPNRGSGWQTSSCFGARYQPYEVACDALPVYIKSLQHYVAQRGAFRADYTNNPPATITYQAHDAYSRPRGTPVVFAKPIDFNTAKKNEYHTYNRDYHNMYWEVRRDVDRDIDSCKQEIKRLQQRLADWRKP